MTEPKAWNNSVSSLLNNVYRCADKSSWYSDVVSAYDRTRPRYPQELLAQVRQITQLQPKQKVVEIGAGVGIATLELAQWGVELVAIEPSLAACELGRQKCANHPNVEFVHSTFENWDAPESSFAAIVASTSFHWVAPTIRTKKSAELLQNDGYLILLWNTPPQPNEAIIQNLNSVYQTYSPNLALQESVPRHKANLAVFGSEMIDSGYFQDLVTQQMICQVNYTVEEYLTLLTTLSPYIQLETSQREILLTELGKVLKLNYGDRLNLSYLSMFQIARRG